jgi:hypothetical protein
MTRTEDVNVPDGEGAGHGRAWAYGALALVVVLGIGSCKHESSSSPTMPLPSDIEQVFSLPYLDGTNDLQLAPAAGPPVVIPYPPVDVTKIEAGVRWPMLYMRVTYAGSIPAGPVSIPAQGGLAAMTVKNQGMSLNLDSDNNPTTGADNGIDVFFAVKCVYGQACGAYANYDFATTDIHLNRGQVQGAVIDGGPGHNFVLVGYDLTSLGAFFRRGQTVPIRAWSEAESFDASGNLLFHHFAFDPLPDGHWTIPP